MTAVPAVTPVAIPSVPVPDTLATDGVLLLHDPPDVVSSKVVLLPWHTVAAPAIGETGVFTITGKVALHPAADV
jgi:hypothetical protein